MEHSGAFSIEFSLPEIEDAGERLIRDELLQGGKLNQPAFIVLQDELDS